MDCGGGIFISNSSSPSLENVNVINNVLGLSGLSGRGGGIYSGLDCSPRMKNVEVNGNTGDQGGGICYYDAATPILDNVRVSGNTADNEGGGIYILESTPEFHDVVIDSNYGYLRGGGLYVNQGGEPGNFIINGILIYNNTSTRGAGIHLDYGSSTTPEIENCTIANNHTIQNLSFFYKQPILL